jgi:lipopolysaccharide transport system permease protein
LKLPTTFKLSFHLIFNFVILISAMLIAIQLRYDLRYGKTLGSKYEAQPPALYALMAGGIILAIAAAWLSSRLSLTRRRLSLETPFYILVIAVGIISAGTLIFLSDISQLQMVYFALISLALGFLLILLPNQLRLAQNLGSIASNLIILWQNRVLIQVWLKYNIQARYTQSILGIAWILLIPLSTGLVIALALTVFLRLRLDVPFMVFFFCGLMIYNIFSQGLQASTNSIRSSMGIINQVAFPREILVLVTLGETLIDTLFIFVAMVILNAFYGFWPSELYLVLIPIALIMIILTLGLMLLTSYLSVIVRDIPQLVGVVLQLFFYLTPLIYPVEYIPPDYQFIFLINPLAPIVEGTRDIVAYQEMPDLMSLAYPLIVGLILLYLGYTLFKANEGRLADMV